MCAFIWSTQNDVKKWMLFITLRFAPTLNSRPNVTQKQHLTKTTFFVDVSWDEIRRPYFCAYVGLKAGALFYYFSGGIAMTKYI